MCRSASHLVGEALPLENRTSPITHSALLEQEFSKASIGHFRRDFCIAFIGWLWWAVGWFQGIYGMSRFLLDTHTFIWLSENNPRLPDRLRDTIDDADKDKASITIHYCFGSSFGGCKPLATHCFRASWINPSDRFSSFKSNRLQVARPIELVPIRYIPSNDQMKYSGHGCCRGLKSWVSWLVSGSIPVMKLYRRSL